MYPRGDGTTGVPYPPLAHAADIDQQPILDRHTSGIRDRRIARLVRKGKRPTG